MSELSWQTVVLIVTSVAWVPMAVAILVAAVVAGFAVLGLALAALAWALECIFLSKPEEGS